METTIINELGQIVPAVGNPLSPARIKAQFPSTFAGLLDWMRRKGAINSEVALEIVFEHYMHTNFPHCDIEVRSAFWRALQCEHDIISKHLNNHKP